MKVSEIPYKRYTIEEGRAAFEEFRAAAEKAKSASEMVEARERFMQECIEYSTAASLSNCRFTLNTRDEFYQAEVDYYDNISPVFASLMVEYSNIMLASPYRAELEKLLDPRIFKFYEIARKSFSDVIIEDSQEENALVTEYSKFMSEMEFVYRGEKMPLSVLRGKLEDEDRDVRREAAEAIGKALAANGEKLDDIFDRLVAIRDRMAKKMGYKNFVELGYYRMNRVDYNAEMVAQFRQNVCEDLVPVVKKIKEKVKEKLGLDRIMFYDDAIYVDGDVPRPVIDAEKMFEAAQEMYDSMNSYIGRFMRDMRDAEAFDVIARDGKWGGGYCTSFAKYKQPFILANFNGSSGDVDVLTHEFGHALASKHVFDYGNYELGVGGMETAECHSMSMEFLSWKYMDKFFGDNADKYRFSHLCSSLCFIPYGVIVDEFQHIVYEHPEMTPAERKAAYRELEKKYRPYLGLDGIPYLEEGTRWQYQMHIYESPFYYIDYCLAQTVALWFLIKSMRDYDGALDDYLNFSRAGGTKSFGDLVEGAGIPSPFKNGSLTEMASEALKILDSLDK